MNKTIITLFTILLAISCSEKRDSENQQNIETKTPNILSEDKDDVFSYSKRSRGSIIYDLFNEAIEKDSSLQKITSRLKNTRLLKTDSLEAYRKYKNINETYWYELTNYSNQLSDSLLKKDVTEFIKTMREYQSEKTAPLDKIITRIDSTNQKLDDLEIMMKILTTSPMMANYQKNEYPEKKTLQHVKETIDSTITEIKPFTEFNK